MLLYMLKYGPRKKVEIPKIIDRSARGSTAHGKREQSVVNSRKTDAEKAETLQKIWI